MDGSASAGCRVGADPRRSGRGGEIVVSVSQRSVLHLAGRLQPLADEGLGALRREGHANPERRLGSALGYVPHHEPKHSTGGA